MSSDSSKSTVEQLREDDFFSLFTPEQFERFRKNAFRRSYQRGQVLFTEGDPFDRVYYMIDGFVRLERTDANGTNSFYCYARNKTFFPYINMFRREVFRYTATAVTDIDILYISTSILEELFKENKAILTRIIKNLEELVLIREERLQYMLQQNARMRVVATISYLQKELGEAEDGISVIRCPISVRDIAELSGTSRETASAVLSKLRSRDIIEVRDRRHFQINNPQYFDQLPEINQIFFC